MHLRQKTSRYCAAVLFLAGINAVILITAILSAKFRPDLEIWLGAALITSLILHARAGFALSKASQEIEMLQRETAKFSEAIAEPALPDVELDAAGKLSRSDAITLDRVKSAVENDRIDLYLQPIVSLPQRKVRYYESFSRLRNEDGSVLRPVHYLEAAERANRIGAIDNLILLRSVQALRNLTPVTNQARIFCNISPATIFDNDFFSRFTDYLDANADLAPKVVFEFTYPAVEMMCGDVEKNLDAIVERGYEFSVDHVNRFDLNWKKLAERHFRFVKCPSSLLLSHFNNGDAGRARVCEFRDRLRDKNLDLIVEKVEFESHIPEILTLGIDYGQGELFGHARPADAYLASDEKGEDENDAPNEAVVKLAVA